MLRSIHFLLLLAKPFNWEMTSRIFVLWIKRDRSIACNIWTGKRFVADRFHSSFFRILDPFSPIAIVALMRHVYRNN